MSFYNQFLRNITANKNVEADNAINIQLLLLTENFFLAKKTQ